MPRNGSSDLSRLVTDTRVHREVFQDPAIFDLEMERIFARSWVYVGHASQVPEQGDFLCTRIGAQPVVMTRHSDGRVHVLYNRCGHRGVKVVAEDHDNRWWCNHVI